MRSAIGNALLMTLVVTIVSLVMLVFVNILAYSKAYRVKNRIIEVIEKYEGYNSEAQDEINNYLHQSGYKVGRYDKCINDFSRKFDNITDEDKAKIQVSDNYKYCVLQKETSNGGSYYIVMAYVDYTFPVIDQTLTTPVSGETKIISINYDEYH